MCRPRDRFKPEVLDQPGLYGLVRLEGLDPLDEVEAYLTLKEMGYPLAAIGRRLGKSQPYVSTWVEVAEVASNPEGDR